MRGAHHLFAEERSDRTLQVRIGIRHAHELLEVRFAAHADVFVDRHQENPTKAILAADRTEQLS